MRLLKFKINMKLLWQDKVNANETFNKLFQIFNYCCWRNGVWDYECVSVYVRKWSAKIPYLYVCMLNGMRFMYLNHFFTYDKTLVRIKGNYVYYENASDYYYYSNKDEFEWNVLLLLLLLLMKRIRLSCHYFPLKLCDVESNFWIQYNKYWLKCTVIQLEFIRIFCF